jgi:riboflavin synthase
MFTGIVENTGIVREITTDGGNIHFGLTCPFTHELKVDQSLSHNGVCLTVTKIEGEKYWVTAISETLQKTNLSYWEIGSFVNLERCMPAHGRFDGHIVQGHVDCLGTCTKVLEENGSWRFYFKHPEGPGFMTVPKGSICVNGVSLTVVDSGPLDFSVAIIPYTFHHTSFGTLKAGDKVNLEFDIIGKYLQKMMAERA